RNAPARGGGRANAASRSPNRSESRIPALLAYAALLLVAFWFTWTANIAPVFADMRFQEGQSLMDRAGTDLNQLVVVLDDYIGTVRSSPGEDFYYLSLGRALMTSSDGLRSRGAGLGEPDEKASVQKLLNLGDQMAVASFIQRSTPLSLMSYAQAVLLKAHELNPLNKDHFANLGRLNSYWYSINHDTERLHQALTWYERVAPIAPNDVTLINERAGVLIDLGGYVATQGDQVGAKARYDEATELLNHSQQIDPHYGDTYLRLGEIARLQGDMVAATDQYVQGIAFSPAVASSMILGIANSMAGQNDQIVRLRDAFADVAKQNEERLTRLESDVTADTTALRKQIALYHSIVGLLSVRGGDVAGSLTPYQRATILQPASVDYSRNYTIVLSDTRRYSEALSEINRVLTSVRASGNADQIKQIEQLMAIIQRAQGGQ
ncbi:MAG: hypothetical protein HGA65_10815, partial [Oscillochloris sp.]|nr:hypothetical protein [Oscillochloris sp.]